MCDNFSELNNISELRVQSQVQALTDGFRQTVVALKSKQNFLEGSARELQLQLENCTKELERERNFSRGIEKIMQKSMERDTEREREVEDLRKEKIILEEELKKWKKKVMQTKMENWENL